MNATAMQTNNLGTMNTDRLISMGETGKSLTTSSSGLAQPIALRGVAAASSVGKTRRSFVEVLLTSLSAFAA